MRIAISGAGGIAALLITASAAAQVPPQGPAPSPAAGASAAPSAPAPPAPPPPAPRKSRPPPRLDAPPSPPPAGLAPPAPPPFSPPVFTNESVSATVKQPPLAGWQDGFFLRDPGDYFRFYPRGRVHLDFHSYPGAPTGTAAEGGVELQPRFFARRIRFEFSGEAFKRWTFTFGVDFGATELNTNGRALLVSGNPGGGSRFVPVEGVTANVAVANAFINYSFCPCLNVMVGQQQAPFGIENRTGNNSHTFMERNLAIRSFVAPNAKELGLTLWGDLFDNRLSYELGVYAGDGQNRPQIDANPDFIGRVFTRPLLGGGGPLEKLQVGVSGRTGRRDPAFVGYDYYPVVTGQGWSLWQPQYMDSLGRAVHVIPSGTQAQIGGELRLPVSIFELRGEAYFVANDTREAIEGFQLTNTERLGRMSGAGWYVQASVWPLGDAFVNGDPGMWRPYTLNLAAEPEKPKRGLEIALLVSGVNADYQGASRGGDADANTPSAMTSSRLDVFQYGVAINYWYTRFLRASLNYSLYHAPGSGSSSLAVVPGNVRGPSPSPDEHLHHELGTRIGIGF